jgi:hypothetical protein
MVNDFIIDIYQPTKMMQPGENVVIHNLPIHEADHLHVIDNVENSELTQRTLARKDCIAKTSLHMLRGTLAWFIRTIILGIGSLGLCVLYLVTLNNTNIVKGYFAINYTILIFATIWLSVNTRDLDKKVTSEKYAQGIADLQNVGVSSGNIKIRIAIAWVGFIISIGIFVIGVGAISLSSTDIVNAILVEIIVYSEISQVVKTIQDRMDARLWKLTLKQ